MFLSQFRMAAGCRLEFSVCISIAILLLAGCAGGRVSEQPPASLNAAVFSQNLIKLEGYVPVSVASDDLNADGIPDLAVAFFSSRDVIVYTGDGKGNFAAGGRMGVGGKPSSLIIADLNGDRHPDIVVACWGLYRGEIAVILSDGKGGFMEPRLVVMTKEERLTWVVSGDFNGDGKLDLAVTNGQGNAVLIFSGNGQGDFERSALIPTGRFPRSIVSGDFNGDGIPDLAVANQFSDDLSILIGNGEGKFKTETIPAGKGPRAVVAQDFNRDGTTDLAVADSGENAVTLMAGDGKGGFRTSGKFAVGDSPRSMVFSDLNGDKRMDLVVANFNAHTVTVLPGDGRGGFGPALPVPVRVTPRSIATGDFNSDGKTDIAVGNWGSSDISLLLNMTP